MRKTKLKIRKNLSVDMAALCDVAFLLLVFFISASHFQQWEPMKIKTPNAKTTNLCTAFWPESNLIIYVAGNKVMFQYISGDTARKVMLTAMAKKYGVKFSYPEQDKFLECPTTGASITQLKLYDEQYKEWDAPVNRPGIPYNGINSELYDWIIEARRAELLLNHKALLVTLKADKTVPYPTIKQVIDILEKQRINKFELLINSRSSAI
jgi:biopolymer transport protein ExbD